MIPVIFFLLSVVLAGDKIHKNFELLVHQKNQYNLTTNNAVSVVDPNRVVMLGLEGGSIYTQEDANKMDTYSINYFNCQFGLQISSGILVAPGVRVLHGIGTFIQYQSGVDKSYRWLHGSNDDKVFEKQKWYIFDTGSLFIFSSNGTFSGGVMAGTTYKNNSIVAFAQYTYIKELKAGKIRTLKDIRIIRTVNRAISYQLPNELGVNQQYLFEDALDEHNRTGVTAVTVSVTQRPINTGIFIQRNRGVLTFNYSEHDPIPCAVPWVGSKWTALQN